MNSVWRIHSKRADFAAISEKFNIDQVVARVIRNRDIERDEDIDAYLRGDLSYAHKPTDMADMILGAEIIKNKILQGKSIRIISDYDVDGVMSNYILFDGLKNVGAKVSYEIPDRMLDGYGINERIIRDAHNDGIDTIITCDNGIAAFGAIALAKELGMTVVVTDHHEIPYEEDEKANKIYKLVEADAVIDIKRQDCQYPFKGLCGAGVAYKFIRQLYSDMDIPWENEDKYIEMLAIATVCDVMDLKDENRIYVKRGLKLLEKTTNIGLDALLSVNDLKGKKISSYHIGFVIGPCINATGRLESAKRGLELLLSTDKNEAIKLAEELKSLNITRKDMTNKGVIEALELVERNYINDTVLVIYMPELHESLAGIVAGKVKENYYRPTFVITKGENEMLKGSGRSIEGYNMFEKLTDCKDILSKFGGHELAAGLSLKEENLDILRNRLNSQHGLTQKELTPVVMIDVPMPISYITPELVEQLTILEPFGKGNEKPIFAQADLGIKNVRFMGKDNQFIKIWFQDKKGFVIEAVDFNANKFIDCIKMWFSDEECDKMFKGLSNNIRLDVAYYPDINTYAGRTTVQLRPVLYNKA